MGGSQTLMALLRYGVMVAQRILVPLVQVRALVSQQILKIEEYAETESTNHPGITQGENAGI